ncbi:hypothetical protein C7S13_3028 [Burkholderia cepacia]|nr:hypothetical protein [Burkholderia cepacia]
MRDDLHLSKRRRRYSDGKRMAMGYGATDRDCCFWAAGQTRMRT